MLKFLLAILDCKLLNICDNSRSTAQILAAHVSNLLELLTVGERANGTSIDAKEKKRMLYAITILPAAGMSSVSLQPFIKNLKRLICQIPVDTNFVQVLHKELTAMPICQFASQDVCAQVAPQECALHNTLQGQEDLGGTEASTHS